MPKNIVICCDGTNNAYGKCNTNVAFLYDAIDRDTSEQIAFYAAGVGTFGPFGWRIAKKTGRALGAAFGYGLKRNLEQAYRFLVDHYEDGDRVFLFGFSRGAFTARSLAGMLHKCGLLYPEHGELLQQASRKYLDRNSSDEATAFKQAYCRECKPWFVGVWDTVGSLGWLLALRSFHDTRLNADVSHGYHALAIDERRRKFAPSLWDERSLEPHQNVHQVWFAGVHSDVGGGYPDRALGDISLAWMLDAAAEQGLRVQPQARAALEPDPLGRMHDSYTGWWRLLGDEVRTIPDGAPIHDSVHARLKGDPDYRPTNLPPRRGAAEIPGSPGKASST